MDKMQGELTDELLIDEFNSEILSTTDIANRYGYPANIVKNRLRKLQTSGRLGFKDRSGKVVTEPGDPSPRYKEKKKKYTYKKEKKESPIFEMQKEQTLADLLNSDEHISNKDISAHHKELLIELLHKLIC